MQNKSPNSQRGDDEITDHDHIIAGVDPAKDREQRRESRIRDKNRYGTSDRILDKLYGIDSRPK